MKSLPYNDIIGYTSSGGMYPGKEGVVVGPVLLNGNKSVRKSSACWYSGRDTLRSSSKALVRDFIMACNCCNS